MIPSKPETDFGLFVPPGGPKIWARMGIRAAYGMALLEIRKNNPKVFAMSADLGRSSGLGRFAEEFPDSYLNVGIAEQLMISMSAGLARTGRSVFASTFAPFATLRAGEFMRMEMGYMQMPVTVVGLGSGLSLGYLGNSHYGLEDIGVVRSMAGILIFSPADASEMILTLNRLAQNPEPAYLRLTGAPQSPALFDSISETQSIESSFFGKVGTKLVVSTGAISGEVRRAVESLGLDLKGELDFGFLHVNQIKPLGETTRKILEASNDILVLEEHLAYGGLSSAIRDARSDQVGKMSTRIKSINLGEEFPQQQSHQRGLELAGLSSFAIQAVLKEFVKSDE